MIIVYILNMKINVTKHNKAMSCLEIGKEEGRVGQGLQRNLRTHLGIEYGFPSLC
jgi:hypothetical protein